MYKAMLRDELVAVKVFPVGNRAKGEVRSYPRSVALQVLVLGFALRFLTWLRCTS